MYKITEKITSAIHKTVRLATIDIVVNGIRYWVDVSWDTNLNCTMEKVQEQEEGREVDFTDDCALFFYLEDVCFRYIKKQIRNKDIKPIHYVLFVIIMLLAMFGESIINYLIPLQ